MKIYKKNLKSISEDPYNPPEKYLPATQPTQEAVPAVK
jgi:hypothetical protein